jgi:hypothetical protein
MEILEMVEKLSQIASSEDLSNKELALQLAKGQEIPVLFFTDALSNMKDHRTKIYTELEKNVKEKFIPFITKVIQELELEYSPRVEFSHSIMNEENSLSEDECECLRFYPDGDVKVYIYNTYHGNIRGNSEVYESTKLKIKRHSLCLFITTVSKTIIEMVNDKNKQSVKDAFVKECQILDFGNRKNNESVEYQ